MSNQQYWQSQRFEFFLTKFFRWYFCFLDTMFGGNFFPNLYAPSKDARPKPSEFWSQLKKHDFIMERVWPWWWFSVPDFEDGSVSHLKKIEKLNRIKRGGWLWFPFSMTMSLTILLVGVPTSFVVLWIYMLILGFKKLLFGAPIFTLWILISLWGGYSFYEWRQLFDEINSIPDFGLGYSGSSLLDGWDDHGRSSDEQFRRRVQFDSLGWIFYTVCLPIIPILIAIVYMVPGFFEMLDRGKGRYFTESIGDTFSSLVDLFKTLFFVGFSNGPLEHFQRLYILQQEYPPIQILMHDRRSTMLPKTEREFIVRFPFEERIQPFFKQLNEDIDTHFRVRNEMGSMIGELLLTNRLNQQDLNGIYWNESRAVAFKEIYGVNKEMESEVARTLQGLEELGVDVQLDGVPYSPYLLGELEKLQTSSNAMVSWQQRASKFGIELDPIEVVVSAKLEPNGDSVNIVVSSGGGEASAHIRDQYRMVLINEECAYIKQNLWEGIEWTDTLEQACLKSVQEDCQSVSTTDVANERLTNLGGVLSGFETTNWWSMGGISSPETPLSDSIFELDYQLDPTEALESGLGWMIADKGKWIRDPTIIEQLQSSFQGIVPPVCTRNGLNIGYHADFVSSYTDAVNRFYRGQDLRERYLALGKDPLQSYGSWYGKGETIAQNTLSVKFPFSLLTLEQLKNLTKVVDGYEEQRRQLEPLFVTAEKMSMDTSSWVPEYQKDTYVDLIKQQEALVERMNNNLRRAKRMGVDIKRTMINERRPFEAPYVEETMAALESELDRIESIEQAWTEFKRSANKVGYALPKKFGLQYISTETIAWHQPYIDRTLDVRREMRAVKMHTIPSGRYQYLDYDLLVVTHIIRMSHTELPVSVVCEVFGEEEDCASSKPASFDPSGDPEMVLKVLSMQMGLAKCQLNDEGKMRCTSPYRLPTTIEWRYAATAKHDFFYTGSHLPQEVAWYGDNSNRVMPMAKKKPNTWGLYDMSGNLAEFNQDLDCLGGGATDSARDVSAFSIVSSDQRKICGIRLVLDSMEPMAFDWQYQKKPEEKAQ